MDPSRRTHDAGTARVQSVTFWESAKVGDEVRLQKPDWPLLEGFVDDRMPDGSIVWVVVAGERRLFHRADGYSLMVLV
ncbi:L-ascorbate metabolism protein UlaG (beta-lactamase superfamily) [Paenarthrobacter nitroguajacolicus]|nr:L-ascorbate metabolism protein UlaG (beta-lactamase superfamily) [Paenarthrobacter nitroguajacolicus]